MAPGRRNSASSRLRLGLTVVGFALVALWALERLPPEAERPPVLSDDAKLMDEDERRRVAEYHQRLLEDHDIDYRVITRVGVGDLERFAYDAFREAGVGSSSERGRGLLLVLDPASDRVRLEVGAALEGVYTDAFVTYLEHRQMVPFFRSGRIADGVVATTELIVSRAQEARDGAAFDPGSTTSFSIGGGASTAARIGAGPDRQFVGARHDARPAATPEATVDAYLAAMRARDARPDLAVYSRATRTMLQSWTITPAQMDAVARAYAGCGGREVRLGPDGARAVVRYAIEARQCSPWFLVREDGTWRIDLASGQDAIRFNHRNQWRLADRDASGYGFGFIDWRLDENGFPAAAR